jgi:hypothetical protein
VLPLSDCFIVFEAHAPRFIVKGQGFALFSTMSAYIYLAMNEIGRTMLTKVVILPAGIVP